MSLSHRNIVFLLFALTMGALLSSCEDTGSMASDELEPQAVECLVENQIPVSFIFDRLDVNTTYRFISCYHTPLDVVLSDSSSCIFPVNKYYDEDAYGFYFMGIDDLYQDRLFGANIHNPRWSHDGNWLVWSNFEDVFKAPFNRDSLNYDKFVRLTDDLSLIQDPIWSTDDQLLLVEVVRSDTESVLYNKEGFYIISANGGDPIVIDEAQGKPVWINAAEVLFLTTEEAIVFNVYSKEYNRLSTIDDDFVSVNRPRLSSSSNDILFLGQKEGDILPTLHALSLDNQSVRKLSDYQMVDFAFIDDATLVISGVQNRVTSLYRLNLETQERSLLYSYTERQ